MTSCRLFSYNPKSQGAKELALALGIKRIKHEGSSFQGGPGDTVINWGSSTAHPSFGSARVVNSPAATSQSGDKLAFFELIGRGPAAKARVPEWSDSGVEARQWIDSGCLVVARTVLRGHSGAGIKILELGVDFVQAPLYTKYVKKDKEFRVHCIRKPQGLSVFDVQRKIKDPAFIGEPNWRVRNHQNGFIYVRNDVQAPEDVKKQALLAFEASGLDFGAVDVIWNEHSGKAFVLEINTAPGLSGKTVQNYADALKGAIAGL